VGTKNHRAHFLWGDQNIIKPPCYYLLVWRIK